MDSSLIGVSESYPRIEAGDTYKFTKNFGTAPLSGAASVWHDDGTLVTSLATVTVSGTEGHYYHTTTDSWYTTVDSSGMFYLAWTAYRTTGDEYIKQYFEVIKTD